VRPPYSTTLFSALCSNLMPAGNVFLGEGAVVEVFVAVFVAVFVILGFLDRCGNHRDIATAC
jgi:hypothetical protein